MNGPVGPTGAYVQCHAVAERHQEVVTVYRHPPRLIRVSDLRWKDTDALDSSAQVSKLTIHVGLRFQLV